MLYHHSHEAYEVAASDAARHARSIMEKKITDGQASAVRLLEHVATAVPVDRIVPSGKLNYYVGNGELRAYADPDYKDSAGIHDHALRQMAERLGLPPSYVVDLAHGAANWQKELAAHNLNEHIARRQHERYLVRSVNGEVRGFLSDSFRRLDNRPLLDTFAGACQEYGAVPVEGVVTDTRISIKAMLPLVFEPVPGEVLCLGAEWGNSDFGNGRHVLRMFIWRLWCTNKATMEDALSQVHLGRRLAETIEFSEETYRLDTEASQSALKDVMRSVLSPAKVHGLLEGIKAANAAGVDWAAAKKTLTKTELKLVQDAYKSDDVINLPAGNTAWRASNAVSWIAGKVEDPDRRGRLERLAGEMVNNKRDAA